MGRDPETVSSDPGAGTRSAIDGHYVCPFCGAVREQAEGACPRCTMESTATTRQATKSRIGPWYVLQTRNPAAPGMKFETLQAFVRKGRVKPRSIVRGPTTHQLWRFAAHVKGLSREFGLCYSCGGSIVHTANVCPHCNRLQEPPINPDVFLEASDPEPRSGAAPVYREIDAAPLVAEEIVVPPMGMHAKTDPSDGTEPPAVASERVKKNNSDGFLSAADLAAAFKLDFQPKEQRGQAKGSPAAAPAALSRASRARNSSRTGRRWKVKAVLLLLLVAAVGVGAYQYRQDAMFRRRVNHWYSSATVWAKQKWAEAQQSTHQMGHDSAKPTVTEKTTGTPSDLPHATQPATGPSPWDQLYHQQDSRVPERAVHTGRIAATASDNNTVVSVPAPAPTAPAQATGNIDDVMALYRSAIDAEGQGDYATAVRKYQQIKQFPKDLWPRDLELRLKSDELQGRSK